MPAPAIGRVSTEATAPCITRIGWFWEFHDGAGKRWAIEECFQTAKNEGRSRSLPGPVLASLRGRTPRLASSSDRYLDVLKIEDMTQPIDPRCPGTPTAGS